MKYVMQPENGNKEMAELAIQIQDASNITPVAGELHKTCLALSRQGVDQKGIRGNPLVHMLMSKLLSLTGYSDENFTSPYNLATDLAAGMIIEYDA